MRQINGLLYHFSRGYIMESLIFFEGDTPLREINYMAYLIQAEDYCIYENMKDIRPNIYYFYFKSFEFCYQQNVLLFNVSYFARISLQCFNSRQIVYCTQFFKPLYFDFINSYSFKFRLYGNGNQTIGLVEFYLFESLMILSSADELFLFFYC